MQRTSSGRASRKWWWPPRESARDRKDWVGFVESDAANFMQLNDIGKMTLDDGVETRLLTRRKDGSIFVESTSSNAVRPSQDQKFPRWRKYRFFKSAAPKARRPWGGFVVRLSSYIQAAGHGQGTQHIAVVQKETESFSWLAPSTYSKIQNGP